MCGCREGVVRLSSQCLGRALLCTVGSLLMAVVIDGRAAAADAQVFQNSFPHGMCAWDKFAHRDVESMAILIYNMPVRNKPCGLLSLCTGLLFNIPVYLLSERSRRKVQRQRCSNVARWNVVV